MAPPAMDRVKKYLIEDTRCVGSLSLFCQYLSYHNCLYLKQNLWKGEKSIFCLSMASLVARQCRKHAIAGTISYELPFQAAQNLLSWVFWQRSTLGSWVAKLEETVRKWSCWGNSIDPLDKGNDDLEAKQEYNTGEVEWQYLTAGGGSYNCIKSRTQEWCRRRTNQWW